MPPFLLRVQPSQLAPSSLFVATELLLHFIPRCSRLAADEGSMKPLGSLVGLLVATFVLAQARAGKPAQKRYLIIAPVGDRSQHETR